MVSANGTLNHPAERPPSARFSAFLWIDPKQIRFASSDARRALKRSKVIAGYRMSRNETTCDPFRAFPICSHKGNVKRQSGEPHRTWRRLEVKAACCSAVGTQAR